jgi:hypothetical protein
MFDANTLYWGVVHLIAIFNPLLASFFRYPVPHTLTVTVTVTITITITITIIITLAPSRHSSPFSLAPLLCGAPYSHATATHHSSPLTYTTVAIHVVIQPTAATKPTTHDASVWAATATCT